MSPMHPIPTGTRDVLPDEMRELRAITEAMRAVLAQHGYGEVWTPAIEFESAAGRMAGGAGAYRLFDEHGSVLLLRSDMTVPIARVAATRYAGTPRPLRFGSFAHVYRAVHPHRGQMREALQAGVELIGAPGAAGTAEVLTVLCRALEAVGLHDFRIGLGDAGLVTELMAEQGVPEARRPDVLDALVARDLVRLEAEVRALGLDAGAAQTLIRVPQRRGGVEVLDGLGAPGARLRELHAALDPEVAARIILDLGLLRDLGYYTAAVFEVYDPAAGAPLGGGGRYDELLSRFGADEPAVGWAIDVDRLHIALAGEEGRGEREP